MIYTSMTIKAMKLAYKAHEGQVDRSGVPYIFHPIHLAEQMETEDEICTALLHDVAEDSDCTIEDLKKEGFSADTIEALRLLTHEKSVPYMDYIAALKGNPIARKVKLADLAHNSDIGRMAIVTDKDLKRMEKYQKARNLLLEE